jgi:hypothetical protein
LIAPQVVVGEVLVVVDVLDVLIAVVGEVLVVVDVLDVLIAVVVEVLVLAAVVVELVPVVVGEVEPVPVVVVAVDVVVELELHIPHMYGQAFHTAVTEHEFFHIVQLAGSLCEHRALEHCCPVKLPTHLHEQVFQFQVPPLKHVRLVVHTFSHT